MTNGLFGTLSQATGAAGEAAVAQQLRAKGWVNVCVDTKGPGSTDVTAQNPFGGGILVQVKSCLLPGVPPAISADERRAIVARAGRLGYKAYLAAVSIGALGLTHEIVWQELNG